MSKSTAICSLCFLTFFFCVLPPTQAKPKKQKNDSIEEVVQNVTGINLSKQKGKKNVSPNEVLETVVFPAKPGKNKNSSGDLEPFDALREYIFGYRSKNNGARGLPPGLAKKVARGGDLPPGWQKKVYPGAIFPNNLFPFASPLNYSQVPRFKNPSEGTDFYSIGNRIFKMRRSDNRILDIADFD